MTEVYVYAVARDGVTAYRRSWAGEGGRVIGGGSDLAGFWSWRGVGDRSRVPGCFAVRRVRVR